MQEPASCFFSSASAVEPPPPAVPPRPGQSLLTAVYRARVAGRRRRVTVTWCRDVLVNGLWVLVEGAEEEDGGCKVEVRPWQFWRRQGAKRFRVEGEPVEVLWDLRAAKFAAAGGDPTPQSGYYVAVVSKGEAALLLGDLRQEALRKSGCCQSPADESSLVSRTEHLFGKQRFSTKTGFRDVGQLHDISIECATAVEPEMVIRVDGKVAVQVKQLHWKFRGNQTLLVAGGKIDVYWDVHGWLFGPSGPGHSLFIFKPAAEKVAATRDGGAGSPEFSLFLYAWKVD